MTRIILCDTQEPYVEALTEYLLGSKWGRNVSVTTYCNEDRFMEEEGVFRIGLLGNSFKKLPRKCQIQRPIYLSEFSEEENDNDIVYKYQNMESFMGKVFQSNPKERDFSEMGNEKQEWICVFSPIFHELRLPFSLCLCKTFSEAGEVLFVDAEQLSILNVLLEEENEKDLLDYLYLLESNYAKNFISDFLNYYEGFAYLPPMSTPSELCAVTKQQWEKLIEAVTKSSFKTVVILLDTMPQGFVELMEQCRTIYLLSKPGSYYDLSLKEGVSYLKKCGYEDKIKLVSLPMTAANLTKERYQLDRLLTGNMAEFIKRELIEHADIT